MRVSKCFYFFFLENNLAIVELSAALLYTWSMSHMTTRCTVLCLRTSLAAEPSPPPMMNTVFGLEPSHQQRISACCYSAINVWKCCWLGVENSALVPQKN